MDKIERIGVFYNPLKEDLDRILGEIKDWCGGNSVDLEVYEVWPEEVPVIDLAVALGGDGTILKVGRSLAGSGIPILAVNMGSLGFLAEINKDDLIGELDRIIKEKRHKIATRELFDIEVKRDGSVLKRYVAVNDVVVKSGEKSRVVNLELIVDDEFVAKYVGDGLIVATPTGSTAYSLAAGGPIVYPALPLCVISAICPHTLNLRPLIVGSDKKISVNVCDDNDVVLSVDGQVSYKLLDKDEVIVTKSKDSMHLVTTHKYSYFEVLRKKLSWGNR